MSKPFSERIGVTKPKSIQTDSMDEDLRVSLWNALVAVVGSDGRFPNWLYLTQSIAFNVLKKPTDDIPSIYDEQARDWLKEHFFKLTWHKVYNAIEEAVSLVSPNQWAEMILVKTFNGVLEREMSAYRFVAGELTPISNPAEVEAIEQAIDDSKRMGLVGSQQHLKAALGLLGKKPEPDYRNAIKEAISAVESVAKQISGKDKATLGPALDELSKHLEIHDDFKAAVKKLYGYTSDEDGIRHAILEEKDIGFDEAKFMVVACSAFVNFLISKANKAGLLKN